MDITKLVNEAVTQEREKKEITSFHISKLGSCLRGIYLERLGVKPDTEFDERTLRVFSVGNIFENWLVDLIKATGADIETQVRVEDLELNVSGYADAVITTNGEKEVLELKSKHSRAFWYMVKQGEGAMRNHQYQVWTYMYLLKIPKGRICYCSKDDLSIAEFEVRLDDKKLENEVMTELRLLNEAWKKQDMSVLPLPEKKSWQEKYCRYHKQCVKP